MRGVPVLVGVSLVGLARRQLGDAFAIAPRAKDQVTRGLYARIPYPMYVSLDVALLGLVVMLREGWLLVVWGAVVPIQAWQARREMEVLQQAFGPAYVEYRRRTWW
jgi:protein-S-isoprenylcysteine O-methyltransferase Ste14